MKIQVDRFRAAFEAGMHPDDVANLTARQIELLSADDAHVKHILSTIAPTDHKSALDRLRERKAQRMARKETNQPH